MALAPSAAKSIATIRRMITRKSKKNNPRDNRLSFALDDLCRCTREVIDDPELLTEALALAGEVASYRGQGHQWADRDMSRFFGYLIMLLLQDLLDCETPSDLFADVLKVNPSAAACRDALGKLAGRALACIQGPPSRSRHTSALRAQAWRQLGEICRVRRDPSDLALALGVAANPRMALEEREAAVEFLPAFWAGDDPDEASVKLLRNLERNPPSRDFLIAVLRAEVDLGLIDEFGAMFAAEDWEEGNEEE